MGNLFFSSKKRTNFGSEFPKKELQARFKVEILGYVSFVRIPRESGDTRHDW